MLTLNRHIKTTKQATVIGTLAVDGWAVTFGAARRGLGGLRPLVLVARETVVIGRAG